MLECNDPNPDEKQLVDLPNEVLLKIIDYIPIHQRISDISLDIYDLICRLERDMFTLSVQYKTVSWADWLKELYQHNLRISDPRRRPHLPVHHEHTPSVQLGCDKLLRMFKVRLGVFRSTGEDSQQVWRSTTNREGLVLSAEWSHRVDWGPAGDNP